MRITIKRIACLLLWAGLVCMLGGCGLKGGFEAFQEAVAERMESESEDVTLKEEARPDGYHAGSDKERKAGTEVVLEEAETPSDTELQRLETEDDAQFGYAFHTLDEEARQVYRQVYEAVSGHQEKVDVSTLDIDVLEQAYKAVCADHGGLFWVSGYVYTQYTKAGELFNMEFAPKYTMDLQKRDEIQQQIDASAAELLAGITEMDSDYDKAKYVFEALVQNVDYDASAEENQNIISVFLNRATVCQGYACAAQYLLDQLGIPCAIVTGYANGESHAWNLVRLDGAYYYMDITWGNSRYLNNSSQAEKYVNYNYMAVTSEEIDRTHRLENSFPVPDCTSMAHNYFIRENKYFSEWDPDAVGEALSTVWLAGGGDVAVKFAFQELYQQAVDYFIREQHIADYCENITSIYYLEDPDLYVLTFHF